MYPSHLYFTGVHYKQVPSFPTLSAPFQELIVSSISINSGYTSRVIPAEEPGALPLQLGNKTECALLGFLVGMGQNYETERTNMPEEAFTKVFTFN